MSILFAALLALVTLFAESLRVLDRFLPEFRWMSFAAGVSPAYAFLEVLPELARAERVLGQSGSAGEIRHPAYQVALLGLLVFYGLEILASASRRASTTRGRGEQTSTGVFATHIAFFAIYSALIGDLLVAVGERGLPAAVLFVLALAFTSTWPTKA